MKIPKSKTKRILMSILLCGVMSGTVYAEGERITVNSGETYEDAITGTYSGLGGNSYNNGGAIDNEGGTISIIGDATGVVDTVFATNSANRYGGAIYNTGGITSIANVNFTENNTISTSSSYGGGAIYNSSSGNIGSITGTLSGEGDEVTSTSIFTGNTGRDGGAIFNAGTIESIENTIFTENKAVSSNYGGGAIYNTGTITSITNTTFANNTAEPSSSSAYGGAIYNNSSGTISEITGSTFEGNSATGSGGAIANRSTAENPIGSITDCIFTGNTASNNGGAIYSNPSSGSVTIGSITGSTFTGNTSGSHGGAIYLSSNTNLESLVNTTFSENSAGETSSGDGGAIYSGGSTIGSIEGVIFDTNTASGNGGAIRNYGTITTIESYEDDNGATVNTTFTGNTASGSNGGGAIYNYSGGIIGTIDEGTVFTGNKATNGSGGAIYNAQNSVISSITGNTFSGNTAENGDGGAIYNYDDATIGSITETAFTENKATGGSGGAIFNFWETDTGNGKGIIGGITESTFEGNTAAYYGGAIFNRGYIGLGEDGETVTGAISGSTFTNNKSERGGAIYNGIQRDAGSDGSFDSIITSIENCYFYQNTADAFGGAIYNFDDGYIWNISGNTFEENKATNGNGGAIENAEAGSVIGTITNNQFLKNDVSESAHGGGAIYSEGSITSITKNNFEENKSGNFGGAIYNNGGTIGDEDTGESISNNTFTGNTSDRGGAIYNTGNRSVDDTGAETINPDAPGVITSIDGNTFSGNIANDFGGAIYNYKYGEIKSITGNTFTENEAKGGNGGAIENAEPESVIGEISGNIFTKNTAAVGGAAIYNEGSIESITGNTFTENQAGTYGGAIYNNGGTITELSGDTFTGNSAVSESGEAAGGAIYNSGTISTFSVQTLSGNYAVSEDSVAWGGAIYNAGTLTIAEGAEISGNHAEGYTALGGAIYNDFAGKTGDITADFSGNYAAAGTGSAKGGAIYNEGSIGTVSGAFSGNYATSEESYAQGGAVYNTEGGEITGITAAALAGNYAESESSYAEGGAIYNENPDTAITVTGDITDNHVKGATNAAGGAIYSMGNVTVEGGAITGNYAEAAGGFAYGGAIINSEAALTVDAAEISGNYVTSEKGNAAGGAIYNIDEGTMTVTAESLTGNYAESTGGEAAGGAIYNAGTGGSITVEGDVTGNYVQAAGGNGAAGGAIFYGDENSGSITINGNVSGNYAESSAEDAGGGAIYTESEDVSITIKGDVTDNYAKTTADGGSALGGAIYSQGTTTVTGAITGNYVEASDDAGGGAIYNEGTLTVNATSVENNHAISSAGAALAGAIYTDSEDSVINVTGNVTGNYVKADAGEATGGAIYSLGTTTIEGDVTGNYAEGADVQGGAIYAGENSTVNLYGNITGNYAKGDTALGGAIYNADGATVNIYVENKDAVISGNYTESGGTQEANVLYGEAGSVTNFNLTDATLRLDDSLNGETGYEVNVTGNGIDATTFYMYNDILDSNLSFAGTTLNTINNEVKTYSVNKLSINGNVNIVADVDMANETMDRFTAAEYGEHAGKINVSGMNLISDTEADSVDIYFAEEGLKDSVTSSVGTLPDSNNQQKAYTPLYQYNVAYDNRSDGGYFTFDKAGNNPSADVPEEGEAAAISFMNLMYRYAFEHSDYYMKLPRNVRQAIIKGENCAEEENCLANYKAYNGHNLTEPGIWVKPFASNETVPFSHQFTARTKNYGLLVGIDTAFKEKGKWANVFTGYAGYDGIKQTFDGNSTEQYGGVIGVTDTLYKGNFYAALTLSGGENVLKAKTMYGREKTHLYMAGAAVKTGYNLEFAGGNYSFLPTFMASYTYADIKDYTSASGLKMDSDGMHAVELNPNFKFIRNLDNGWMPYVTVGEIWTVGQHSEVKASGTKLDELTFRPYTEYGLGVQKMWSKGYDGYAEFLGHAGGRRGFLVNLGFRWTF